MTVANFILNNSDVIVTDFSSSELIPRLRETQVSMKVTNWKPCSLEEVLLALMV